MSSTDGYATEKPVTATALEDETSPDDTMFAFDIPSSCTPGSTVKLQAPDGLTLQIPLPKSVLVGDQMHMEKVDGKWKIMHVVRPQAVAQHNINNETGKVSVQKKTPQQVQADLASPYNDEVCLETSKGTIKLNICSSWAPLGAQRFLQLVTDNHFDDLAIYRGVPKFLVQFGITNDPKRMNKYSKLGDDPLRGVPIEEGSICFSAAGPNSRDSSICLFLGDFPQLGQSPWETPIGKVKAESMDVLRSIFTGYGDMPQCKGAGPDPVKLEELGNDYITEHFPKIDFVKTAAWSKAN